MERVRWEGKKAIGTSLHFADMPADVLEWGSSRYTRIGFQHCQWMHWKEQFLSLSVASLLQDVPTVERSEVTNHLLETISTISDGRADHRYVSPSS